MPIKIELKVNKNEFLCQESPQCVVTVKNNGSSAVAVPSPEANPKMPSIRVVNVKTGEETIYEGQEPPESVPREIHEQIAPGKSLQMKLNLFDRIPDLEPGKHDVSVGCEPFGAGRAESNAVRLVVLPSTSKSLSTAYVAGGTSAMVYGVWINTEADPPQIVRGRFEVIPGASVTGVFPLADGHLQAVPVPSSPPNRSPVNSQWVAWLKGETFFAAHFDERMGASNVQKLKLGAANLEVVQPLYTETVRDTTVRPNGAALVVLSDPDGVRWQLNMINLSEKKIALVQQAPMPGPRPSWVHSYSLSDRQRWLLYAQEQEDGSSLSLAPWPSGQAQGPQIRTPIVLTHWKKRFVAGGAALDAHDMLNGACLVWVGSGASLHMEMVCWQVTSKGEYTEKPVQNIPWDATTEASRALVRINGRGMPAALVRNKQGSWFFCCADTCKPLPGVLATTKLPLDLAYVSGEVTPVLICGRRETGFSIVTLDGEPVPGLVRG